MKKFYHFLPVALIGLCLLGWSSLMGQNLLTNAGFETGNLDPWFGDNGNTVTIVQDTSAEGSYAAMGNAAQNVELTDGVNYELRCKAKILAAASDERVWIGVRGPSGLVQNSEMFSNDWEDMAIDFTAPETGTFKIWVWGTGQSSYMSDAWTLVVEGTTATNINDQTAREKIQILKLTDGISVNVEDHYVDAKIVVYGVDGRVVVNQVSSQPVTLIEKHQFPSNGVYVVSVSAGDLHRTEKVLMVRD